MPDKADVPPAQPPSAPMKGKILVFGDPVIDGYRFVVYETEGERTVDNVDERNWQVNSQYQYHWVPGGPFMLRNMIAQKADEKLDQTLRAQVSLRSFADVKKFGGFWRASSFGGYFKRQNVFDDAIVRKPVEAGECRADSIIVVDDAGNGLRSDSDAVAVIKNSLRPASIVVHKMFVPLADSHVWRAISEHSEAHDDCASIMIVSADDLRRQGLAISKGLSWKRTFSSLKEGIKGGAPQSPLANLLKIEGHASNSICWLIVRFDCDAVAVLSATGEAAFFCDPGAIEGDWDAKHPGDMIGRSSMFTANVVRWLADFRSVEIDLNNVTKAAIAGLAASRAFVASGMQFDPAGGEQRSLIPLSMPNNDPAIVPFSESVAAAVDPDARIETAFALAQRYLVEGDSAFGGLPHCRFNKLVTVDNDEIEGYRVAANLLKRRFADTKKSKPISIAIFGPPGAGKSFGLKEIVESVAGSQANILEFNVSQFGPDSLQLAMNDTRDSILGGKDTVCLFDEFDSNGREWLQKFLAPMQDGKFADNGKLRPIGPATFVFIGGTITRYGKLEQDMKDNEDESRRLKLPDFVSRLSGYINIRGPNPVGADSIAKEDTPMTADPAAIIRRATILRGILRKNWSSLFVDDVLSIDKQLVRGFLLVPFYKHGTRSIEQIVQMSNLNGRTTWFSPSALPPNDQLDMHVNASELRKLLGGDGVPALL